MSVNAFLCFVSYVKVVCNSPAISEQPGTVYSACKCLVFTHGRGTLYHLLHLLVSDPVSDSMLQPLKHLLSSSDDDVLKAASLALSNFALYGSG